MATRFVIQTHNRNKRMKTEERSISHIRKESIKESREHKKGMYKTE